MDKNTTMGLSVALLIVIVVIALVLLVQQPMKDIDVRIVHINYENEAFYINVSLTNNQENTGWISDTYLTTVEGNAISLTGAGIDETVDAGETVALRLFSAEVYDSLVDPPLKLVYTAFPQGTTYSIDI